MAQQRLGIIMNGVTGRMGMNQHLIRSIVAIREEGGKHFVDLALSTTNQDGKEVASGSATARTDP